MVGLGILSLIYRDFAYEWQPVPASLPGRQILVLASGLLLVVASVALRFRTTVVIAVRVLFPYLLLWQRLKVQALIVPPGMEAVWLGSRFAQLENTPFFTHITGEKGIRMARILFAVALIPIGLSHIVYVKITAGLVPAWLPFRAGWAYLTAAGQIACGLGVLFSVYARAATMIEVGMLAIFALLVWGPPIAAPSPRFPLTAFLITWAIGASAWLVATNKPSKQNDIRKGEIHG
jgi:uncharacterized membrane protein